MATRLQGLVRSFSTAFSATRILRLGSSLVTLGFLGSCLWIELDAHQYAARQADQAAANVAAAIEQDVSRNIELFGSSLQTVSKRLLSPEFQNLSPQLRNMVLFDGLVNASHFGFLNVLNEDGDEIADARAIPPPHRNFASQEYFRFHRGDPQDTIFIGKPVQDGTAITISRRISRPDGTFAGVVAGSMKLAYFENLLESQQAGPNRMITLLRNDGMILMRVPFDPNDVGRVVTSDDVFRTFLQTREPRIDADTAPDHRPRRYTTRQVGNLPLIICVGFATDDIFADWRAKATWIFAVVAGLCIMNAILTVSWRRQWRQRAAAEAAAQKSATEYRTLTENVSDIVARVDADGISRYVSPAAKQMLGLDPAMLVGRSFGDSFLPEDRPNFEAWLSCLRRDSGCQSISYRQTREDGSEIWIDAIGSPLIDTTTRKLDGFVIVSRDVTARHQLEIERLRQAKDLEQAKAAAERASVAKSRFVATMSHEVRTPLTTILGYAELLSKEGKLNPAQMERLAAIHSAGEHLRDVVNKVLDYSRAEAATAPTTPIPTDLRDLLSQCHAILGPSAREKKLVLTCVVEPDVPLRVLIDGARLRQILVNLINNAIKFTDRGSINVRIGGDAQHLQCMIADTGIGIPMQDRGRLFEPYERLDADKLGIEGAGLGLAISKRFVEDMDGTISCDENPAGGTVFRVELPIGRPEPIPPCASHGNATAGKPLRVLVADDTKSNRDIAASFLRQAGHTVTESPTGEEAVRLATENVFDIVLVDMRMPGMNGVEVARRISNMTGRAAPVPIIAVTAQIMSDGEWANWRDAGITGYLAKPYCSNELLAAVAEASTTENQFPHSPHSAPGPIPEQVEPLVDAELLAQVQNTLGLEAAQRYLQELTNDISTILVMLRDGATVQSEEFDELAHQIAGSAGLFGFSALFAEIRRLRRERLHVPTSEVTALTCLAAIAEESQRELRRLIDELRRNPVRIGAAA